STITCLILMVLSFDTMAQPANDDCADAIDLTVNASLTCTATTSGTTVNATQSLVSCGVGANADDDVWFKFVATQASHIIKLSNVSIVSGSNNWRRFEVFDTCDGASIYCTSSETVPSEAILYNLIPNKT